MREVEVIGRDLFEMTDEERDAQRRSFVYGNTKLHNAAVTKEMVDDVADRLEEEENDKLKARVDELTRRRVSNGDMEE